MPETDFHNKKEITKSSFTFGIFTLISRVSGFARDMAIAYIFGTSFVADAFLVAFRIPNTFRRFVGEGALNPAFIPVFADYLKTGDKKQINQMISAVFTFITIIVSAIVVLSIIFAKPIVQVLTLNFSNFDDKFNLTVILLRIIFPYLLMVSLAALMMGILNSIKNFWISAAAPIALNLSLIFAMIFISPLFGDTPEKKVYGLALGVLVGGILQFAFQFIPVIMKGFHIYPFFKFAHEGLRKVIRLMLPTIYGQAIHEVNIIVDTMLAWGLGTGAVSYLYYSNHLMQLPLGVFTIAISTVILPLLSRNVANNSKDEFKKSLFYGMEMVLFIMLPCSIILLLGGKEIIYILFERGKFDHISTMETYFTLCFYSIGLVFISGVRIMVQAFYANKDTKTPVNVAIIAMILNIILNLILIRFLRWGGLALATSISAMFNFSVLIILLKKRVPEIRWSEDITAFLKIIGASFVMAVSAGIIRILFAPDKIILIQNQFLNYIIFLVILCCLSGGIYLLSCHLSKVEVMSTLFKIFLHKEKKEIRK
ncbi:MAG: murein biosynthesis integral membrane protein MurJ [bacterium]|nr:murein biosynthesis integral membrane protein MurJ [bacterium]